MKASEVLVGALYSCKVSGKLTTVKITGERLWPASYHGWNAINIATGRAIRTRIQGEWP